MFKLYLFIICRLKYCFQWYRNNIFLDVGGYILSISDIDLKINNCSLYIQWKTLDMNVSCANYLVTVFENGNKRIDTHIASSKYIFDGIISAATYEVRVVCKENSTRLKLNSSPGTLKGTISAFPSSATLLVFIYFHIIINDKSNLFVI